MVRDNAVSLRLAGLLLLAFAFPAEAAPKTICGLPVKADAAVSPDGRLAAFIRDEPTGDPDPEYAKAGALWLRDCRTGRERKLMPAVAPRSSENSWITLGGPVFSLDGRIVYVDGAYGGSSLLLYQVDLASGHYAFVAPVELYGIIRTGRYRGDILATQHTLLYSGKGNEDTGYGGYPIYVFDSQGRALRYVGGSQDWDDKRLRRWLKGQGWELSWAGKLVP